MQFIFLKVLQAKNSQQHTALKSVNNKQVTCIIIFSLHICAKWYRAFEEMWCFHPFRSSAVCRFSVHATCPMLLWNSEHMPIMNVLSTLIRRTYVFLFNICCHANVLVNLLNFWKVDRSLFSYLCCNFCLEDNIYILHPSQIISRFDFF